MDLTLVMHRNKFICDTHNNGIVFWSYYMDPYNHGTSHPLVVDGGDGLQKWRVFANILNKQSWTDDKRWSSNLESGEGLTNPHRKKNLVTIYYTGSWAGCC